MLHGKCETSTSHACGEIQQECDLTSPVHVEREPCYGFTRDMTRSLDMSSFWVEHWICLHGTGIPITHTSLWPEPYLIPCVPSSRQEIAVISAKNAVLGITKTLSSTRYSREVNGGTDASAKMASVGARANGVEL